MSNGASKNYDEREKNNWRRWQWNRIVENLKATNRKPQNSIVLYLAGIENLDLEEALRRGFRKENLIAVDREKKVVSALRSSGVLAVCSDLSSVLFTIPFNLTVDVVVADFCAGIQREPWNSIYTTTLIPQTQNCILAVNLQRGRDPESGDAREKMQSSEVFKKYAQTLGLTEKHRGLLINQLHWNYFWSRVNKMLREKFGQMDSGFWDRVRSKHKEFGNSKGLPSFNSYRSKTENGNGRETVVFFDSAVYQTPSWLSYTSFVAQKEIPFESLKSSPSAKLAREHFSETAKSLVATMAVRTRRINGFASN